MRRGIQGNNDKMGMKMKIALFSLVVFVAAILAMPDTASAAQNLDQPSVDAAVKKGLEYLKGLQKADGSWCGDQPLEQAFPYGTTALVTFALLKGGEPKDSACIQKAIAYLRANKYVSTYGTSCLILTLCALIEEESVPGEKIDKEKGGLQTVPVEDESEIIKAKMKKAPPWIRQMIQDAVKYLISKKGARVWRYPGTAVGDITKFDSSDSGDQDASNTQYVIMAFYEARRIGIKIDQDVFSSVADYFLSEQEEKGPEVESFRVPGADLNFKEVLDAEKEWMKNFNELLKREKEQSKKDKKEFKGIDLTTAVGRDNPYDKYGGEMPKMCARGWAYLPKAMKNVKTRAGEPHPTEWTEPVGSMTCSGIIACMLAKAHLQGTSWYNKNGKKLEQAIRDGFAWIVKNWSTAENPQCSLWKMYYFYAVERAGVLAIIHDIGPHDWYYEIGSAVLSLQRGDGSWSVEVAQPFYKQGPIWDTCFAILFLKRATTPIIKEDVIYTGEGLLGGKPAKEGKPAEEEKKEPAPSQDGETPKKDEPPKKEAEPGGSGGDENPPEGE
jgi:hypothetical protein